jgi:hypothetical protein
VHGEDDEDPDRASRTIAAAATNLVDHDDDEDDEADRSILLFQTLRRSSLSSLDYLYYRLQWVAFECIQQQVNKRSEISVQLVDVNGAVSFSAGNTNQRVDLANPTGDGIES